MSFKENGTAVPTQRKLRKSSTIRRRGEREREGGKHHCPLWVVLFLPLLLGVAALSSPPLGGAVFLISSVGWCCTASSSFIWCCCSPCALWAGAIFSVNQHHPQEEEEEGSTTTSPKGSHYPRERGMEGAPPNRRKVGTISTTQQG